MPPPSPVSFRHRSSRSQTCSSKDLFWGDLNGSFHCCFGNCLGTLRQLNGTLLYWHLGCVSVLSLESDVCL